MAEEVKLLGVSGSPFTRRAEIALKLKGVHYKYVEVDMSNKLSPLLLKYNPVHMKAPVLLHHDKPIPESLIILEYIEDTWTDFPILPNDPFQRAKSRFLAKFIDDKWFPVLMEARRSKDEECEKAIEEACKLLKVVENELKDKFFGGDTIGIVDIACNFIAHWLPALQEATGLQLLSEEKFPKLWKWSQDFVSHSVVWETLPPRDQLVAFYRARFQIERSNNSI